MPLRHVPFASTLAPLGRRSLGLSAEILLVLIQGLLVMTTTGADETNLGLVIAAALDQFT